MNEQEMLAEIDRLTKENEKLKKEKDDKEKAHKEKIKKTMKSLDDSIDKLFGPWPEEHKARDMGYKFVMGLRGVVSTELETEE